MKKNQQKSTRKKKSMHANCERDTKLSLFIFEMYFGNNSQLSFREILIYTVVKITKYTRDYFRLPVIITKTRPRKICHTGKFPISAETCLLGYFSLSRVTKKTRQGNALIIRRCFFFNLDVKKKQAKKHKE